MVRFWFADSDCHYYAMQVPSLSRKYRSISSEPPNLDFILMYANFSSGDSGPATRSDANPHGTLTVQLEGWNRRYRNYIGLARR